MLKTIFSIFRLKAVSPIVWIAGTLLYVGLVALNYDALTANKLPDNDDYMRLQEVRDFLNGQAWADTDQHRFVTDEGGSMHFSRLPDVFMAGLVAAAKPFVGQHRAELFMVIAWPWMLLIALMASANLAIREIQPRAVFPLAMFTLVAPTVYAQFLPGRIDHHGFQMVLAMAALLFALRSMNRPVWAIGAAVMLIAMLIVGMETAPIVAATAVAMSIPWLFDRQGRGFILFGLTLIIGAPLALVIMRAGGPLLTTYCDAYSPMQTLAVMLIGGVAVLSTTLAAKLKGTVLRLGVAGVLALAAGGCIVFLFPHCLAGPFGHMDSPELVEWRSGLSASQNFLHYFERKQVTAVGSYGPILAAFIAAIYLLRRSKGAELRRMLIVSTFFFIAALASLWMLRSTIMALSFALLPAALAASRAAQLLETKRIQNYVLYLLILIFITPIGSLMVAAQISRAKTAAREEAGIAENVNCFASNSNFSALNEYQEGLVLTQIDLGAEVLALTKHSITSAPYHRNHSGIERVLKVLNAPPERARVLAEQSGASYMVLCLTGNEARYYSKRHPDGLFAKMSAGYTPDWLEPLDVGESAATFYRIK